MDWTKINLSMGDLGITGARLDKVLLENYNIYIELFTGDWIMALTGIGIQNRLRPVCRRPEDISRRTRESGLEIHRAEHNRNP